MGAGPLIRDQGFITLNEPTAGAGAMILAAADVLERQGFDPAFHMIVMNGALVVLILSRRKLAIKNP